MGDAEVIPFPQPEARTPDCRICVFSIADASGTYCRQFQEEILFERSAAEECPEFEDDPWKD